MTLREEQSRFAHDVFFLLVHAWNRGFEVTIGEVERPIEMQRLYVQSGRSKTMASYHLKKLAVDLHFFLDGELIYDKAKLQFLGDYWESLAPGQNSWGGNWNSFKDIPHFERRA